MGQETKRIFAVVALAAAPLFFLSGQGLAGSPSPVFVSIAPPAAAFDSSDLDVRDEFNRPVRARAAVRSFQRLWESSLSRVLANNLTPGRRWLLARLNAAWDAFASLWRRPVAPVAALLAAVIADQRFRRPVKADVRWLSQRAAAAAPRASSILDPLLTLLRHSLLSSTRLQR